MAQIATMGGSKSAVPHHGLGGERLGIALHLHFLRVCLPWIADVCEYAPGSQPLRRGLPPNVMIGGQAKGSEASAEVMDGDRFRMLSLRRM